MVPAQHMTMQQLPATPMSANTVGLRSPAAYMTKTAAEGEVDDGGASSLVFYVISGRPSPFGVRSQLRISR